MPSRQVLKRELLNLGVTEADMIDVRRHPSEKRYDSIVKKAIGRLGYFFPTRGEGEYSELSRQVNENRDGPEDPTSLYGLNDRDMKLVEPDPAFHDVATEILDAMIKELNYAGRARLVQENPLAFLGKQIQFYTNDDHDHVLYKESTTITYEEARPLINWAILNETPDTIICRMVCAYKNESIQQPFDTIWETFYRSAKPPLHIAIECGRLPLVESLLGLGTSLTLRYSEFGSSECLYAGTVHQECAWSIPRQQASQPLCNDALRYAFALAKTHQQDKFPPEYNNLQYCIIALLEHGAQINIFEPYDGTMTQDFRDLLELRFTKVIQAIIDSICSLPERHPTRVQLALGLDEVLQRAIDCFSAPSEEKSLVLQLLDIGARAVY